LADTVEPGTVMAVAQHYLQLQLWPRLETAMRKMTTLMPENPEAHYDLSAVQAVTGRFEDSVKTLQKTLQLSDARRATNPAARDLRQMARTDARFASVAQRPDFRQLIPDYQSPAPPSLAPPPKAP
jgi:hypothetical protein